MASAAFVENTPTWTCCAPAGALARLERRGREVFLRRYQPRRPGDGCVCVQMEHVHAQSAALAVRRREDDAVAALAFTALLQTVAANQRRGASTPLSVSCSMTHQFMLTQRCEAV